MNARAIFNTMNHPEPETFLIGESGDWAGWDGCGFDGRDTKRAVKNRHRPGLIGLINASERSGENSNISPRPRQHFYIRIEGRRRASGGRELKKRVEGQ